MRWITTTLFASGSLLAMVVPALADAPFMPIVNAPDHVVTMATRSAGRETGTRTHIHHAGWTRIDAVERGRPWTQYFGHASSVVFRVERHDSGEWSLLSVRRGDGPTLSVNRDRFMTGETRTIVGETCQTWNVLRGTSSSLALLSCVTADAVRGVAARRDAVAADLGSAGIERD